MAWCPFAARMELFPESPAQATINPTQFIVHSIAAPWTARRTYEYWRDSTNLESHMGLGFGGDLGQYLSTTTRADANARANVRAVSMETASNLEHTDPWTSEQVEMIIRVGAWLHEEHGLPLRKCRTWDDPGYGYHRMFPEWSVGGTACPGDARVKQFNDIIFPEIVRRAQGGPVTPPVEKEETELSFVFLEKGKTGDASAVTLAIPVGVHRLNLSVNYVDNDADGKVRIRFDVMNASGTLRKGNTIWDFVNGQWGYMDVEGPATVGIQRLDNAWSHVSVTLEKL